MAHVFNLYLSRAVDFTWKELQTLRAKQRFSFRDQQYNGVYRVFLSECQYFLCFFLFTFMVHISIYSLYAGKFPIITFEEYIDIALDAPSVVGIYPEIKDPIFINKHVSFFLFKLLISPSNTY